MRELEKQRVFVTFLAALAEHLTTRRGDLTHCDIQDVIVERVNGRVEFRFHLSDYATRELDVEASQMLYKLLPELRPWKMGKAE